MKLNYLKYLLLLSLLSSVSCFEIKAQNLDNISKKSFGISGSIGGHVTFYDVNGIANRRDPFFWQTSANLNIKALGVNIPFSMTLNQQQRTFTQPFNQFGLSPTYKWLTLHLGYRTLRFSDFSLNGNMFLGIGAEVKIPETKFTVKGFYGRFAKSIDNYYQDGLIVGIPTYERWGWGTKVEYGDRKHHYAVQVFKAKDDATSLNGFENDVSVRPSENLVFGLSTRQQISNNLKLDAEIDWSAFTKDIRVNEYTGDNQVFLSRLGGLYSYNSSSSFNKAMKANVSYSFKNTSMVSLSFRHIDPEYQSMGSIYLNNDFQDIRLNYATRFIDNKLSFSTSAGLQRNNLDKNQTTSLIRLIGGINTSYAPIKELNFSLNLSNYSATSKMVETLVEDTLQYVQVTNNINFRTTYTILRNEDKNKHNLYTNVGYQNARINGNTNANFYNASLGWQYAVTPLNLNTGIGLTSSRTITEAADNSNVGPTATINKRMLHNKLIMGFVYSHLFSFSYGQSNGMIQNIRYNASFSPNKHHKFYGNFGYVIRNTTILKYNELITTIGYNFFF